LTTRETDGETPKVKHPWRRYLARSLDMSIYSIIWGAVSMLVLRWNSPDGPLLKLLEAYITFGIMFLLEPLFLSTLGTTPGKWIFGLQVRDFGDTNLSYGAALSRAWGVFHYGYGYFIPFYSLYRMYKSYKMCRETGELQWDEECAYTISDTKIYRAAAYTGAAVLLLGLTGFIVLQADMPRHRGDLTAAEFTQNMNDLMDFSRLNYGMHLDTAGKWTEDPDGSHSTFAVLGPPLPDFEMTETNGTVTKVSFQVTSDHKDIIIDNFTNIIYLAVKSYVCAREEINCLSQFSVVSSENTAFTNFEFTRAGITVKNSVSYEGYQPFAENYLCPIDGKKQYFHLEFSMEKTD
jgi:hypothetical protein